LQLHRIPTPKIYHPIWQQFGGLGNFYRPNLLNVKNVSTYYSGKNYEEKEKKGLGRLRKG
jgi:hypothetical protein